MKTTIASTRNGRRLIRRGPRQHRRKLARNGDASHSENGSATHRPRWKDFSQADRLVLLEEAFFEMTRRPPRPTTKQIRRARFAAKSNKRKGQPLDAAALERARREMNNLTPRQRQRLHAKGLAMIYGASLVADRG